MQLGRIWRFNPINQALNCGFHQCTEYMEGIGIIDVKKLNGGHEAWYEGIIDVKKLNVGHEAYYGSPCISVG